MPARVLERMMTTRDLAELDICLEIREEWREARAAGLNPEDLEDGPLAPDPLDGDE